MKQKILIIGATGLVGNAVAKQLHTDGYDVVVMSRSRTKAKKMFSDDFEIIEADVLSPDAIKHSFTGIDGVFISLPEKSVPEAIPHIIRYSKASQVKHIVYTSGCTVREENAWHPMIKGHFEGERAIVESEIPYTILRLTMVMDMIPRYANNGKPFILGKQIHGWSWIHSSDIARMASAAFSNEKAKNKKLTVWGKEKLTIAKAVEQYNQANHISGKTVTPKPYWIANLLALIVGEKLRYAISIFKYFENHPEEGNPQETYSILTEPQMTLNKYFDLETRVAQNNN
ncbi:MAG: NAD(P)H-binding protein [Bacteroidales bacterium]|nr:NAD(P)H-binding protein [Bacteroidales bacterium]